MRKPFTIIDGVKVFRSQTTDRHTVLKVERKCCAVCGEFIDDGEEVSLLMSNSVLFPNVWVHDTHLDFHGDIKDTEVERLAQQNIVKVIIYKYVEFDRVWRTRKIWGNF